MILILAARFPAQDRPQSALPPRWAKAQEYASRGIEPLNCFAGQVRVRGKRVIRQQFSVYLPNVEMKCCGTLVRSARTDAHGHFFVEPLKEGEYFAQFDFKGVQYVAAFGIVQNYESCSESGHVEINFSDVNKARIQSFIDINDSGDECQAKEPNCFRK
jgi:hypothetical protein